ncbi:hypothetical protein KEM48_001571 [Puccinia striiformis f. sp. tritici PST-130]|nr:hypothetical protein KEM48_001571 [Puccinia striiformis f. sp. tritici PST-130]
MKSGQWAVGVMNPTNNNWPREFNWCHHTQASLCCDDYMRTQVYSAQVTVGMAFDDTFRAHTTQKGGPKMS